MGSHSSIQIDEKSLRFRQALLRALPAVLLCIPFLSLASFSVLQISSAINPMHGNPEVSVADVAKVWNGIVGILVEFVAYGFVVFLYILWLNLKWSKELSNAGHSGAGSDRSEST